MMSRLTKSLREAMLETILSHAFDAKQKNAEQQKNIVAGKIYQDIYGSHLIAMESLPKGFLEKSSIFYISITGHSHRVRLSEARLVGHKHDISYHKAKLYVGDEAIAIEYQKAVDACDDLETQRKQMSREITPVLESVHTFKKLWEVWPESKSLLEKFEEKPTIAILPAVQVEKLNTALATGNRGAASATGYQGAASATGYQGAASATGEYGAASATGKHAVACGLGWCSKAMADETGAIVLVFRNMQDEIIQIRASKVGENGIKPNTWYQLDVDGEFVEVE